MVVLYNMGSKRWLALYTAQCMYTALYYCRAPTDRSEGKLAGEETERADEQEASSHPNCRPCPSVAIFAWTKRGRETRIDVEMCGNMEEADACMAKYVWAGNQLSSQHLGANHRQKSLLLLWSKLMLLMLMLLPPLPESTLKGSVSSYISAALRTRRWKRTYCHPLYCNVFEQYRYLGDLCTTSVQEWVKRL